MGKCLLTRMSAESAQATGILARVFCLQILHAPSVP